jgi:hypothetical protein
LFLLLCNLYDFVKCKFALPRGQTPILVAARSKAWVCVRSLAGITGSNPAGGIDACLL